MKTTACISDCRFHWLASAFALAFLVVPSAGFGAGGVVDQSIDAAYNLRDQLQQVVTKSVKGVGEAMQEGPPPSNEGRPFTRGDLQQIRDKNSDLLNRNQELAKQQQKLANIDAELLSKLPADDPRRKEISKELKQIASQMPGTRQQIQNFSNKVSDADTAINRWQRNDPGYVSPPPKKKRDTPPAPADSGDTPNTDDSGGGNTDDGGLGALKQKEAAQEAATRTLGKERESAVNKYLDDPSDENHADAEAIKQKLDGMVDDLNTIRGQVDVLDGGSRPPLHVRSAKAIAKEHQQRKNSGTNTDGTETQPGSGGGCGMGASENNQHNADGGTYQDVGSGGSGTGSGSRSGGGSHGHGHRSAGTTRRTTQSKITSSQSHQHGAGKMKEATSSNSVHVNSGGGANGSSHQSMSQQKNRQQRRRGVQIR